MSLATAKKLTPAADAEGLDAAISRVRSKGDEVALVDLMSAAEHLLGSMQTIFSALDTSVFREFRSIASSITKVRSDIGNLQPQNISDDHIPEAGKELQAIVTATEDATNTIMEASENLLSLKAETLETYKAAVEAEVMRIFEACSFQDITGQRVSKVVEALEDIDERVGRIAEAFGSCESETEKSDRQIKRDDRKKAQILHGPSLEGEGVNQGDVDQILSEQSTIDAMFD